MITKIFSTISKYHWLFLILLAHFILFYELNEHRALSFPWFEVLEYILLIGLLLTIGALFDLLYRSIQLRTRALKAIENKHNLIQEFAVLNDWKNLVTQLVKYHVNLENVQKSTLFLRGAFSNLFEEAATWPLPDSEVDDQSLLEYLNRRLDQNNGVIWKFHCRDTREVEKETSQRNLEYVLPLYFGGRLYGVMVLTILRGKDLTSDQKFLLEDSGDELAFILKMGMDRHKYLEMTSTESAMEERRNVSRYLHDNLGHNLAYLRLKLSEMAEQKETLQANDFLSEIESLRQAAEEAYDTCRRSIEAIRPDTTPLLTNLLLEHARKVAKRTRIKIDFKTKGRPFEPALGVKQALFYVFEEALSNIEKHSKASKVDVQFEWGTNSVKMIVHDNGVGFNPQSVDTSRHFGLEILRERIEQVQGKVDLMSVENLGTTIEVCILNQHVLTGEQI